MNRYVARFGLMAVLVSLVSPLSAGAAVSPSVRLSELQWAGSGRSLADEWIELANTGDDVVDVSGWILSGVATGGQAIALEEGTHIAPRDTLLIANYAPSDSSTLDVVPDLVTTAISIPNTSLSLLLLMPDGTVVDSLVDAGAPDAGNKTASMERDFTSDAWVTATTSTHLLDGQLGTPGAPLITETPTADDAQEDVTPTLSPVLVPCQPIAAESIAATVPATDDATPPSASEDAPIAVPSDDPVVLPIEEPVETQVAPDAPVTYEPVTTDAETAVGAASEETVSTVPEDEDGVSEVAQESEEPSMPTTGNVVLNEFVSDPIDGSEWIEVRNLDPLSIDVSTWTVRDASGKATLLATTLAPEGYAVIMSPLGKLNNDGDTLELVDAIGTVVDLISYDKSTAPNDGASLARNGDAWAVATTPTPGAVNIFPVAETTEALRTQTYDETTFENAPTNTASANNNTAREAAPVGETPVVPASVTVVAAAKSLTAKTASKKKSVTAPSFTTIASLADAKEGDMVRMTGELIALPGVFGAQIAVIEGATLYLNNAAWPVMELGDLVTAQGEVTTSRGELRIKITDASGISLTDADVTAPTPLTEGLLHTMRAPTLVLLTGTVVSRENDLLTVDSQGIVVRAKAMDGTGVRWSTLNASTVTIIGVLRQTADGPVVMPRSPQDVTVQESVAAIVGASLPEKPPGAAPWIGAGLLTSTVGTLGYWLARSRNLIPSFSS